MRLITKESGWSLHSIKFTDIVLQRYEQRGGYGWHRLPKWLARKKALINPKNQDDDCFFDACAISANSEFFKTTKTLGE